MQNKNNNKKDGYTIIETMIATSIFLIVIMIGMGALLNANLLHQKSGDLRSIVDNLSFILEDMSRNMRTGYQYYCITGNDTLSNVSNAKSGQSCWGVAFEPATGSPGNPNDQWVYYIGNTGKIFKSTLGPYITDNFIQLTPNEIVIDTALSGFSVEGAEAPTTGNQEQPFVTIKLVGTITSKNVVTPFSLQTSVSQRLIDI